MLRQTEGCYSTLALNSSAGNLWNQVFTTYTPDSICLETIQPICGMVELLLLDRNPKRDPSRQADA